MIMFHWRGFRKLDLKVSFLEGGPGWLVPILDRAIRDDEFFGKVASKPFDYYLTNGNVQIGCEGNDASLSYVASRIGIEPFAYSSDYPHEVDLAGAMHEIVHVVRNKDSKSKIFLGTEIKNQSYIKLFYFQEQHLLFLNKNQLPQYLHTYNKLVALLKIY